MSESLLVEERRRELLRIAKQSGRVLAAQAAERFEVSEDTIRRDLRVMAAAGLVQRVRGGALPAAGTIPYNERVLNSPAVGEALIVAAAKCISEIGGIAVLDNGRTGMRVARALAGSGMTVATSAPATAAAACEAGLVVHMLGGRIDPGVGASVDATAIDALRQIRADVALLGTCSFDPENGMSTSHAEEVPFKKALVRSAAEVLCVVSQDRLGTTSPYLVADTKELTHLMLEKAADGAVPSDTAFDDLAKLDIEIQYV